MLLLKMVCLRDEERMNKRVQFVEGPDAIYTGGCLGEEEEEEEETHGDEGCREIHQGDKAGDSHCFGVIARVLRDAEHRPRLARCC